MHPDCLENPAAVCTILGDFQSRPFAFFCLSSLETISEHYLWSEVGDPHSLAWCLTSSVLHSFVGRPANNVLVCVLVTRAQSDQGWDQTDTTVQSSMNPGTKK